MKGRFFIASVENFLGRIAQRKFNVTSNPCRQFAAVWFFQIMPCQPRTFFRLGGASADPIIRANKPSATFTSKKSEPKLSSNRRWWDEAVVCAGCFKRYEDRILRYRQVPLLNE